MTQNNRSKATALSRQGFARVAKDTLVQGSIASVVSTVALSIACALRGRPAASGTNASSHWVWGRSAYAHREIDLPHTALGYAIHHASSMFWAAAHAAWHRYAPARRPATIAARAAGIAALAAVVDYAVVPRRLSPGFEAHLKPGAIACVYAAFAIGLGMTAALQRRRQAPAKRQAARANGVRKQRHPEPLREETDETTREARRAR